MNDISKAIKACNEEIQFYKNELKQPYMKENLSAEESYIRGHDKAYSTCCEKIKTFEFIKTVFEEKQNRQCDEACKAEWCPTCKRWLG